MFKTWTHPDILKSIADKKKKERLPVDLIVTPDGKIRSSWWSKEIDEILEHLGVAQDDVNRNPLCG